MLRVKDKAKASFAVGLQEKGFSTKRFIRSSEILVVSATAA